MKNKKSIIIVIVIIISIIILTFFGYICKKEKFYLEDNYYNYDMTHDEESEHSLYFSNILYRTHTIFSTYLSTALNSLENYG